MYDVDSYEAAVSAFDWDDYRDACDWDARSELNMAHEVVDRHRYGGESLALLWIDEDGTSERITFESFARESDRFANVLTDLGVADGDRVMTHLPRIPEHYYAIVGTLKTGAIFGAINERYGVDGVEHRLADSHANVVVTTPENLEKVEQATADVDSLNTILVIDRNDVGDDGDYVDYLSVATEADTSFETVRTEPDEPALLYYTSGTTGPAKGVLHGHRFTIGNAAFLDSPADVGDDDLYWVTGDPGWLTGLNLFGATFWGVPCVVYAGEFDPVDWAEILDEHPITILWSVPTAFRMMKERDDLFDGKNLQLRNVLSVGEPLDAPVIEWGREQFGTAILDSYGTSETYGAIVSNFPYMDVKPGSMGRPHPGVDVKVCEPGTLNEVEPGEIGEIVVRKFLSSFIRYWEREEKTEAVTRDGWIFTDDLVEVDEEDGAVNATPVEDPGGEIPSWVGEEIPVPYAVAQHVGRLRSRAAEQFEDGADLDTVAEEFARRLPGDGQTMQTAFEPVAEQVAQGHPVPTDQRFVVEGERGGAVLNAPLGHQVNETLGRLLSALLGQATGSSVGLDVDPYRIDLAVPPGVRPTTVEDTLLDTEPDHLEAILELALKRAPALEFELSQVAATFGSLKRWQGSGEGVGGPRLRAILEDTPAFDEAIRSIFHDDLDVDRAASVLRALRSGDVVIDSIEGRTPLGEGGQSSGRELLASEQADAGVIETVKQRIRNDRVRLVCLHCREWTRRTKVKRVPDQPACPECGSTRIASLNPWADEVVQAIQSDDRDEDQEAMVQRAYKAANLVQSHGKQAVIALAARGVGPQNAARIIANLREDEDDFYRDILQREREYARTRSFWD